MSKEIKQFLIFNYRANYNYFNGLIEEGKKVDWLFSYWKRQLHYLKINCKKKLEKEKYIDLEKTIHSISNFLLSEINRISRLDSEDNRKIKDINLVVNSKSYELCKSIVLKYL